MADLSGLVTSVPTTPNLSSIPSNMFFEANHNQDDENSVWDAGQVGASPGSKRCPTFKDYAEKIKQLQQENFQLRVRVFLCEQKTGVKTSSSDFAVLFQQNMQQLQNAFNANNNANASNMTHSMTASTTSSSNDMFSTQLGSMKSQNELLTTKAIELEQKVHNYELALKEKQRDNDRLMEKNADLLNRIEDLETEFTLTKIKLQQQQMNHATSSNNDDEVERGARIAFGQLDEEVDECKRELEAKLKSESAKVHELGKNLTKMKRDVDKALNNVAVLEREKKESDTKLVECSKALMEFGKRNLALTKQVEEMKSNQQQQTKELNDSKMADSSIMQRYRSIREVVGLLQTRVLDIVSFIETLLSLESKKVFTLTGLKDENRENLRVSAQHCQMLSKSLDQLFETGDDSELSNRRLKLASLAGMSMLNRDSTFNSHCYSFDRGEMTGEPSPKKATSIGIQCKLIDRVQPLQPGYVEKANSIKLKRDLDKSEQIREKLMTEQSKMRSRIATLESNIKTANEHISNLEKATRIVSNQTISALQTENNTLTDRLGVSESALRKLHQEHAKLVAELKVMRSIQIEPIQEKLSKSYTESGRPSDSTSPDLGIDSGHDGAVNSDDSNSNSYKVENRILRNANRELAQKLRQTRQALDNTLEKLHSTSKQKEQVEKAICRQLHKTHTILRQAKKSVEKFTANQCQENIVPSTSTFNSSED